MLNRNSHSGHTPVETFHVGPHCSIVAHVAIRFHHGGYVPPQLMRLFETESHLVTVGASLEQFNKAASRVIERCGWLSYETSRVFLMNPF